MANVEKIGDIFDVNTSTAGIQFTPAISALQNGGFVVVWDFVNASIVGQLYDEQAFRSGGEFVVSTTNNNSQFAPDVATLSDGTFVVTWGHEFSATDLDVRARRFSEAGAGLTASDYVIRNTSARDETLPSITAQQSGRYLVTWSQDDNEVNFVQHDANGGILSGPGPIDAAPAAGNEGFSSVTALVDGTYVVAFEQGDEVFQRRLVAGAVAGQTNTNVDGVQERPSIAALENGGYVVVWNDRGLYAAGQRYDFLGNKVGPQQVHSLQAPTPGNLDQTTPTVKGLVGGGFIVVWDGIDGVQAQARNEDGTLNGARVNLTPAGAGGGSVGDLEVTQKKDGDVVVVWGGSSAADNVGILGQVLRVFNNVNGTAGNDRGATALSGGVSNLNPGFQANDIIKGLGGDDVLQGFGGADDTLDGGEGSDTATYIDAPSPVAANLLIPAFSNGHAIGDHFISIENLEGSFFSDQLTGNNLANVLDGVDGNDFIVGNGGNDTLDGNSGDDDLEGGQGHDTYVVDSAGDIVTELAGEGTDLVRSSVTRVLGAHQENLTLTGDIAINGVGNAFANRIIGNVAANTLNGSTGADRLEGGAGDDIYYIDVAGDVVVEGAGLGVDRVVSPISYTLTPGVDNLTLTGALNLTGTGNTLANLIQGNTGANTLVGLGGADRLFGNNGNDRLQGDLGADMLTGGAGRDLFVFAALADSTVAAAGRDTILDFVRAQTDKIVLSAIDADVDQAPGDQGFSFIGSAAFSNVDGQLRTFGSGANTFVEGDVNGDSVADFQIRVVTATTLLAGDFSL